MSEQLHAGDRAEYCGRVKALRGRQVHVVQINPWPERAIVHFMRGAMLHWRCVKPKNLKRLGGGVLGD